MITAIHIENFKGIRDRVKVDLKPITLLFGPNSAGKSTIVQAIHYAREVLLHGNLNPDRTRVGGAGMDLGGFMNFLHRGHVDIPELDRVIVLRFDIELEKSRFGLPTYPADWVHYSFAENEDEEGLLETLDDVREVFVELRVRWSHLIGAPILSHYAVGHDGEYFAVISCSDDGTKPYISYLDKNHPTIRMWEKQERERTEEESTRWLEEIKDWSKERVEALLSEMQDLLAGKRETTDENSLSAADPVLMQKVKIDISGQKGVLPRFDDLLGVGGGFALDAVLSRAIAGPGALLRDALAEFRYVGPVREIPPRHHEPSLSYDEAEWANGLAAWDRLAEDQTLLASTCQWLHRSDRLDTGYELVLKQYKVLDLESPLALELMEWEEGGGYVDDPAQWFQTMPTKRRLVLLKHPELLELKPHDVGTGLAKMVPVIAAAIDKRQGIVVIEEPESNIHPRWQVALGDLFIEQGVHNGQTFLLETHSEHLVLRLLRRIRETAEGEAPQAFELKPEDINVVYVESDGSQATIHQLRVDKDGEFIDRWPGGFFGERGEELF